MADELFAEIAHTESRAAATQAVIDIAEAYVRWLRKLVSGQFSRMAIEEIDTGEIASTTTKGTMMANIDSSQRVRWTVLAKDDRGFAADYALGVRASDAEVVTVEYLNVGDDGNTSNGTTDVDGNSTEFDQVLATFAGKFGTSTVEVFDPANPDVVLIAGTVVANPGAVASAELVGETVEEIPAAPEPAPEA